MPEDQKEGGEGPGSDDCFPRWGACACRRGDKDGERSKILGMGSTEAETGCRGPGGGGAGDGTEA